MVDFPFYSPVNRVPYEINVVWLFLTPLDQFNISLRSRAFSGFFFFFFSWNDIFSFKNWYSIILHFYILILQILHCYVSASPLLQKRQVQNKFSLVPTSASETSPCLDWAQADEKQQLVDVAFYGFNWLNMTLSGQKMVRKIYKKNHPVHIPRKKKAKKIDRKIKSCLCSFYSEYTLTNA